MTVSNQKEGFIALSLDGGYKPAQFVEGKELDLLDAFGGAPPALRDLGGPGGLLRFSRHRIFLWFRLLHRVKLTFASACGRKFLEGRTSITPRIEAFQSIENRAKGNYTLYAFCLILLAILFCPRRD